MRAPQKGMVINERAGRGKTENGGGRREGWEPFLNGQNYIEMYEPVGVGIYIPRVEEVWIIYETKYGLFSLLLSQLVQSKRACLASTYFSIGIKTRKKFQEHISGKKIRLQGDF